MLYLGVGDGVHACEVSTLLQTAQHDELVARMAADEACTMDEA